MIALILKFNILLLFITLTSAMTIELPCMTNERNECLPDYILTDQRGKSFVNRQIYDPLIEKEESQLVKGCYSQNIQEIFIHKDSLNYAEQVKTTESLIENAHQKDNRIGLNTVYVIEVDPEYAEYRPTRRIASEEHRYRTINNQQFINLRKELDAGDINSLNVKRLQLLPEISDNNKTYWDRIYPYVFTSIVQHFNEYYNDVKDTISDSRLLKCKKFLLYTLYVVEKISQQVKHTSYIKLNNYLQELDQELQIKDKRIFIKGEDQDFDYKESNSSRWLRDIRDYDPQKYETYLGYMIRCYKRKKFPLEKSIVIFNFHYDLVDAYGEFPVAYSTLLLKILFTHPANDLPPIDVEDTASMHK